MDKGEELAIMTKITRINLARNAILKKIFPMESQMQLKKMLKEIYLLQLIMQLRFL